MDYISNLFILVAIYIILSQSLSLVSGHSGLISLAHAGFYGIGAYTTAILGVNFGISFPVTLPLAMLFSGITSSLVSVISFRIVNDYFIIVTLGIQVVVYSIVNNWQDLTNGPQGISNIPSIVILGYSFDDRVAYLLLSLFLAGLVWFILNNISQSPFGRVLIGISEDEIFVQSLGKNVRKAKVISFSMSGMLASIGGVLFAHHITYIDPTSFTLDESILILSMVIIGGMRNLWKIALSAAFLVLLPEGLRFLGMPDAIAANMRQIIYGILLIIMIVRNSAHNKSINLMPPARCN